MSQTSDVDAPPPALLAVTLTAAPHRVTLSTIAGLMFIAGDGTDDTNMVFTLTRINAALFGMTFRPQANFNGTASISLTVSDQGNPGSGGPRSDADTITIVVTSDNDPPTGVADMFTLVEDSGPNVLNVLMNDSTAPDTMETLTIVQVTSGMHGIVSGGGSSITYTPNANYFGPDTFAYTIQDANGGVAATFVTITVGADADRDGLSHAEEWVLGIDPMKKDTDGDGVLDSNEDVNGNGTVDPGETDPNKPDSHGGGSLDGDEVRQGTNPMRSDDDFFIRSGSGCSTAPGFEWWGVLALVLLSTSLDVQRFKTARGPQDMLNVYSARLFFSYADDPLVLATPGSRNVVARLVDDQMTFDVMVDVGLK